ncbi:Oidioi.mRNA.OKI2018_I69.chr2.g4961.t1.cds [Oikopleura dioica]|uniref:Oidioi.mRNA.OKI2018_I69.chr2.g4961.t1.cds n=1 Tax=Oikopleura dioica TaxID=34765 RepID=A0ABN7T299_OIKDI|nr:Oidioi.mRNA.OKI2018_I69.chr2.g4961.t1.cds [Oikopleura dioica]
MRYSFKIISFFLFFSFVQAKGGRGGGRGGKGAIQLAGALEGWEDVFFVVGILSLACCLQCCWYGCLSLAEGVLKSLAENKEEGGQGDEESGENILLEDQ